MRTQMYTCHISVLRRALIKEVGGFDAGVEGSQDWDLVLRVTERARRVLHVPKVLYHWRPSPLPPPPAARTLSRGRSRPDHARCRRTATESDFRPRSRWTPSDSGVLHLRPRLREQPLVSIVIPTAGQVRDVRFKPVVLVENCVRGIVENSTYENYEIIVVADHELEPPTLGELGELAGDRLRVVPAPPGSSTSRR